MRVVALISGGKDSCYNMMQCVSEGHEIVALANLKPSDKDELDSYMYQTVGHHGIDMYTEAMGLPLYRHTLRGEPVNKGQDYTPCDGDEVEDLYHLLQEVQTSCHVEGVSVGAILSDYQRVRVENVCSRLGLTSLAYLWRRNQSELLQEMIDSHVHAIIIKVAALGLDPQKHIGKTIAEIQPHMKLMKEKYGLNVCGEGGEYETFTLDCPLFNKKIIIDKSEMVNHSEDAFAPVSYLNLTKLHLEDKSIDTKLSQFDRVKDLPMMRSCNIHSELRIEKLDQDYPLTTKITEQKVVPPLQDLQVKSVNYDEEASSLWLGGVVAKITNEDSDAIEESTKCAMEDLKGTLEDHQFLLKDVVTVHLFVADMSLFGRINSVYKTYFGLNPPSRVCVEACLPSDLLFQMDCYACSRCDFRKTMHVQGQSHWAPANIGPYSQAGQIDKNMYIAGQIPLVPGTMRMIVGGFDVQCSLSIRHAMRILDAMDSQITPKDVKLAVCYVTHANFAPLAQLQWEKIYKEYKIEIKCNAVFVVVPALPKNAMVEWQLFVNTQENTTCSHTRLQLDDFEMSFSENKDAVVCSVSKSKESPNSDLVKNLFLQVMNQDDIWQKMTNSKMFYIYFDCSQITYQDVFREMKSLVNKTYRGNHAPAIALIPMFQDGHHLIHLCGI